MQDKLIERSLCVSQLSISASESLLIASYKISYKSIGDQCNYTDPEDSFLIPGGQTSRILNRFLSEFFLAVKELKSNAAINLKRADKGSTTVILNKTDKIQEAKVQLNNH